MFWLPAAALRVTAPSARGSASVARDPSGNGLKNERERMDAAGATVSEPRATLT
jgi:hypothetical protein